MRTTRRAWLRGTLAGLAAGSLAGGGCAPGGADLIVATTWPEADRAEFEAAMAPARIVWVEPSHGDDPTRLVSDGLRADVALGGPIAGYAGLAGEGRLDDTGGAAWIVARRTPLGVALGDAALASGPSAASASIPSEWRDLSSPRWSGRVALADPRVDPVVLATARAHLERGPWGEAYADLVRAAGSAGPIARDPSEPLARLVRGEADVAPTSADRASGVAGLSFFPWPDLGDYNEGAAVLAGSRNADLARRFVAALAERVDSISDARPVALDPSRDDLLADLLGATLVEAQPELISATTALRENAEHRRTQTAAFWMVQPPPWPPASIGVLSRKPDGPALVEELAAQLAPDVQVRRWLLASWSGAEAPLDLARLGELAGAVGGRLAAEPRFRAWLRGEWVAWARQRYRRAGRVAAGKVGQP